MSFGFALVEEGECYLYSYRKILYFLRGNQYLGKYMHTAILPKISHSLTLPLLASVA